VTLMSMGTYKNHQRASLSRVSQRSWGSSENDAFSIQVLLDKGISQFS